MPLVLTISKVVLVVVAVEAVVVVVVVETVLAPNLAVAWEFETTYLAGMRLPTGFWEEGNA